MGNSIFLRLKGVRKSFLRLVNTNDQKLHKLILAELTQYYNWGSKSILAVVNLIPSLQLSRKYIVVFHHGLDKHLVTDKKKRASRGTVMASLVLILVVELRDQNSDVVNLIQILK